MHGQGKATWVIDGKTKTYEGFFDNGVITGIGKITFRNGDTYEGEVVQTKSGGVVAQGKGVYNYANANRLASYTGYFVNQKFHGRGTLYWHNGNTYTGNFKEHKRSGQREEFIEHYLALLRETPADEPVLFMDSTHPTMATKVVCGWIKKGMDKPVAQTASRTRVNVTGAIGLAEMKVTSCCPEYVNAETTVAFFDLLKAVYPDAPTLHIVLDQSGYHRSKLVQEAASERHSELHYLPPYSPNLNPIERVWKVMNEKVRNNVFFSSTKEFREKISHFFEHEINKIAPLLRGRINNDFQTIKPVS